MTTYESSAKAVAKSSEQVYSQISNLKNLAKFQEKIEATGQVSNLTMTDDEISFDVSMAGKISLQIAETVPGDYVKYQLKSVLKDAELKIKVYAKDENASEIQLFLEADLPLMVKAMLGGKLTDGIEKLATIISIAI